MNARDLIKKVRRLDIATRRAVQSQLAGGYHSVFKGRGMAFADVRPYQIGDDWRAVDWNVTARTGTLHVKQFVEERELVVLLLVDLSASLGFATRTMHKRELAAQLAALIGFSAIRNRDKVGLLLFTDRIESYLPPKQGRGHGLRVVREILGHEPQGRGTRLDIALEFAARVVRHGTALFVVSDFLTREAALPAARPPTTRVPGFMDRAEKYVAGRRLLDSADERLERALRVAAVRHDLVGLEVVDRFEDELPNVGLLEVRDLETGATALVDTASKRGREQYAALQEERRRAVAARFARLGIDHLRIRTDEDPVGPLVSFFAARRRRAARA